MFNQAHVRVVISVTFNDFCRCMVEAGYDYSTDSLPDPAVWEQLLNKSPIKHIAQVYVLLPASHNCGHKSSLVVLCIVVTFDDLLFRYGHRYCLPWAKMTSVYLTSKGLNITELWRQIKFQFGKQLVRASCCLCYFLYTRATVFIPKCTDVFCLGFFGIQKTITLSPRWMLSPMASWTSHCGLFNTCDRDDAFRINIW